MTRPLRPQVAAGVYHVTARGNDRQAIFRDDHDRAVYLSVVQSALARYGWRCLAYCLMSNHYHLVVVTPAANLARGMRQINGVYAQRFNRRHDRSGHLFEGRYGAVLVQRDSHLLSALRYVALNPVGAGLCDAPEEWPWSSHATLLGLRSSPLVSAAEALAGFGDEISLARERYRRFVAEGEPSERSEGVIAGSRAFASDHAPSGPRDPEIPRLHWHAGRPPLDEVLETGDGSEIATAYRAFGYTLRAIAEQLGCHTSTVSRRLQAWERGSMLDCKT